MFDREYFAGLRDHIGRAAGIFEGQVAEDISFLKDPAIDIITTDMKSYGVRTLYSSGFGDSVLTCLVWESEDRERNLRLVALPYTAIVRVDISRGSNRESSVGFIVK